MRKLASSKSSSSVKETWGELMWMVPRMRAARRMSPRIM